MPHRRHAWMLMALAVATACDRTPERVMLGTLEWDRIDVHAQLSEPVIALEVKEGDAVEAGQLLLRLDPRRADATVAAARAQAAQMEAQLSEFLHGSRPENIEQARADLASAESAARTALSSRDRNLKLYRGGAIAKAAMDEAENALKNAAAAAEASRSRLTELLRGTRIERIEQGEAALAAARAQLLHSQLDRDRLDVRAPREGRVDALPFRLGDQPPAGASVVGLLSGPAPYARVWIPERLRASTQPGRRFIVWVDGVSEPFEGVLRSVRSEPAFTPYYALTGDDAERLSYRAEILLSGDAARGLPAGIPCRAEVRDAVR